MIKAENIHKHYGLVQVLKGIHLEIAKGEVVSLVGASGAGKTTLLQIIGTLDKANQGTLLINGTNTSVLKDKAISKFRNENIGFIFQFHNLLPEFTAIENVCIPAFIGNKSKAETMERAKELLIFLGLENRLQHKPSELSGGEQQRVAAARALINEPTIILADEPTGNLDSASSKELHQLFFSLRDKFQQTFLIATHNKELANMADRKIVIQDGMVI